MGPNNCLEFLYYTLLYLCLKGPFIKLNNNIECPTYSWCASNVSRRDPRVRFSIEEWQEGR